MAISKNENNASISH